MLDMNDPFVAFMSGIIVGLLIALLAINRKTATRKGDSK